jgi:ATP-dependent Clp protease protease subunit
MGDRHQLRDVAAWLEPFDQAAVDIYAARTGLKEVDLAKMLDRETWIGGSEAVTQGFADSLLAADEVSASAKNSVSNRPVVAAHKIDALLSRSGVSKSERRELLAAMRGGKSGAVPAGMQDAAVIQEVESLLASMKSV